MITTTNLSAKTGQPHMQTLDLLLTGSFLAMWVGTTFLLSALPWFRRKSTLSERLAPHTELGSHWVEEVDDWLRLQ